MQPQVSLLVRQRNLAYTGKGRLSMGDWLSDVSELKNVYSSMILKEAPGFCPVKGVWLCLHLAS